VLVPGFHGGMFDHNTIRVLTSFHIVFLTFDLFFRQVTNDSSKGATVMIIHAIILFTIIKRVLFLLVVLLTLFHVTGDDLEEAIVKVAEGNILDEI
jgi:predicted membrane protein